MIQIDMEMPEKCGLCPLFHAEHPMYCQGVEADRKKKIVAPYRDPRPEWCPLHEVTNLPPAPILCNKCKHYQGVHDVQGHAPCDYWESGGVLWNWYCSHAEQYKGVDA